jgi:CRP/FNR family cyclic AMP-dependent transcriptional regulator
MNPPQIASALQACDLFQRLEPAQIQTLAQMVEVRTFRPQQPIFSAGDQGDSLFVLSRGRVELRINADPTLKPLGTLQPPDAFGELALLSPGARLTHALALDEVTTLELTSGSLRMIEMSDPALAVGLLSELHRRLAPWFDTCRSLTRQLYLALANSPTKPTL